jgi:hypothetical protein
MDKMWKRAERRFAQILGGVRTGPTGRDSPDVTHPTLAPEVKTSQVFPKYLRDAIEQAETNAPPGKLPFVLFHFAGNKYQDDLAVFRVKDAVDLLKRAELI